MILDQRILLKLGKQLGVIMKRCLMGVGWFAGVMVGIVLPVKLTAQDLLQARPLVTRAVDASRVTEIRGTERAQGSVGRDVGAVDGSESMGEVMLVLNRPAERTAELERFLDAVQSSGGPEYHRWLTPDEFGRRFGPADADVAAVSGWLASQGLRVTSVSRSRQVLRFSGTVGAFNRAFSTRMDRVQTAGGARSVNALPLHVPEALGDAIASVSVGGEPGVARQVASLRQRATFHADGQHAHWTLGDSGTPVYALAPADLAMQYDLGPLYATGVNGAGTIVGILGDSNINAAEVDTFRSLFGVAKGPVQVIVDGEDPGTIDNPDERYRDLNDDPTVSYVGVETAGGVAPGAQIRLYVAGLSEYEDPLVDAAQRAVDDDQADVLSLGYSQCEAFYAFNSYAGLVSSLWQQAAAQGQTVVVGSGYRGSAGCGDLGDGNQANGLGSTPWNLSVGGTDFYYSDYASGGASAGGLWNASSDPVTKGSLKAALPEQVWNDTLGLNAVPVQPYLTPPWAGGGAPSSCGLFSWPTDSAVPICTGGWPKPAWQSGNGVPQDGVRDTPDVSMFAGDGENFSAYAICEFVQDCVADGNGDFSAELVGGTSAAAPAMAGIMALVDQKYGRQGQAAQVFYALAKIAPAAFHDVTRGGNYVACTVTPGLPDCVAGANGTDETPGFAAAVGYDLASGLGTIDAAQLVNHWGDVSAKSSATSLQLSAVSFQHGQSVTASVKVTGSDGGVPTGDVALTTTSSLSAQQGQGSIALVAGAGSESLSTLPGGSYQVVGRYGGDGVYGLSASAPVSLTVTPETSEINFQTEIVSGHYFGYEPFTPGYQATYGEPIQLFVHPTGASGDGVATGTATFTLNTTTYAAALNAGGYGTWTPQALPVGQYTASASYSGDASFSASTSSALPFSVGPALATVGIDSNTSSGTLHVGDTVTVGLTVGNQQLATPGTLAPTGQVEAILGDCGLYFDGKIYYQQIATLVAPVGTSSTVSSALLTIPNVGAGYYCLRVLYSGDVNYDSGSTLVVDGITVLATAGIPTTTLLQVTPTTIVAGQKTKLIATVAGPAGSTVAPTGTVTFYDNGSDGNGYYLLYAELLPGLGGTSVAELTQDTAANFFNSGSNSIIASYSGDSIYSPSSSVAVILTATQPGGDFKLEASQTSVTVAAGKSSTVTVNLTALLGFTGTVNLACAPSTSAAVCSISPATVALTNSGTATLSFQAYTVATGAGSSAGAKLAALAALLLLLLPRSRRRWQKVSLGLVAFVVAGSIGGCGGNTSIDGGGGGSNPNPPTPAGSYTMQITGTSGSITHEVSVLVTVQ
jgi:hypothetical protein